MSRAYDVTGPALHTGVSSSVSVFRRAQDGRGIRFLFPGFIEPLEAGHLIHLRRKAHRATELTNGLGARLRTPEHLLAAALFFSHEPLDIRCDAAELPCLDGSALPFFKILSEAANAPATVNEYPSKIHWEYEGAEGFLQAEPDDFFSVSYTIEHGSLHQTFALQSAATAAEEVIPARTFIMYRDWKTLTSNKELLAGAGQDSGLLLAESHEEFEAARRNLPSARGNEFPLLDPAEFRFTDEAARHKVLDLLGDLALNGLALPKLRLTIRNGGHALNHLLLDQLQKENT